MDRHGIRGTNLVPEKVTRSNNDLSDNHLLLGITPESAGRAVGDLAGEL